MHSAPVGLTSLVCGDVHRHVLRGEGALARDTINSLDLKGIWRVGPKAADEDPGLCQAQLPGYKLHVVITAGAAAAVRPALLTDNVVGYVITPACLPGRVPL